MRWRCRREPAYCLVVDTRALSEAIRMVERDVFIKVVSLAHRELQRWGIERPRLAVAALNRNGARRYCLASKRLQS